MLEQQQTTATSPSAWYDPVADMTIYEEGPPTVHGDETLDPEGEEATPGEFDAYSPEDAS